jgi:hypothetical protein
MLCLALFSIGTASSRNSAAIFITRFFAGVFYNWFRVLAKFSKIENRKSEAQYQLYEVYCYSL